MYKRITITNKHPDDKPKEKLTVELSGGSPWYGYIWIEGEIYTVIEGARTFKIKKTR